MNLINFESVTSLFRNPDSNSERKQLLKEVLLMVLARATSADTNIDPVEISAVQTILAEVTGETFSKGDIHTAANSEIFERQSLDRYLARATRKLNDGDRILILRSLISVIGTDKQVREFEIDYFDRVAQALKATPSEIAGLQPGPVKS